MRWVWPAPDPAPELVELRKPEALGVLYQHHGRIGNVDTYFDHRGRDQHLGAPVPERTHGRLLVVALHVPVNEAHREVGEDLRAEPAGLGLGAPELDLVGFVAQ